MICGSKHSAFLRKSMKPMFPNLVHLIDRLQRYFDWHETFWLYYFFWLYYTFWYWHETWALCPICTTSQAVCNTPQTTRAKNILFLIYKSSCFVVIHHVLLFYLGYFNIALEAWYLTETFKVTSKAFWQASLENIVLWYHSIR